MILCISMQWFREWEGFVKGKDNGTDPTERGGVEWCPPVDGGLTRCVSPEPPGPIDNSKISLMKGGHVQLRQGESGAPPNPLNPDLTHLTPT